MALRYQIYISLYAPTKPSASFYVELTSYYVITGPASVHLAVDHMEVVQVVQTGNNSIPLVAGKSAVVRVFPVMIEGAQPLRYNGYKVPLMRNLVKRAIRGTPTAPTTT